MSTTRATRAERDARESLQALLEEVRAEHDDLDARQREIDEERAAVDQRITELERALAIVDGRAPSTSTPKRATRAPASERPTFEEMCVSVLDALRALGRENPERWTTSRDVEELTGLPISAVRACLAALQQRGASESNGQQRRGARWRSVKRHRAAANAATEAAATAANGPTASRASSASSAQRDVQEPKPGTERAKALARIRKAGTKGLGRTDLERALKIDAVKQRSLVYPLVQAGLVRVEGEKGSQRLVAVEASTSQVPEPAEPQPKAEKHEEPEARKEAAPAPATAHRLRIATDEDAKDAKDTKRVAPPVPPARAATRVREDREDEDEHATAEAEAASSESAERREHRPTVQEPFRPSYKPPPVPKNPPPIVAPTSARPATPAAPASSVVAAAKAAPASAVPAAAPAPERRTIKIAVITDREDKFRCDVLQGTIKAGDCTNRQEIANAVIEGSSSAANQARVLKGKYLTTCGSCADGRQVAARLGIVQPWTAADDDRRKRARK